MPAPGWRQIGPKSARRYVGPGTGPEGISRRQYDKLVGRFAPGSQHAEQGIRTPEVLTRRRKQAAPPPKQPPARFWGGWRVRTFATLEAAITFVRTLGHRRCIVSARGLYLRSGGSGTENAPGWASTPVFFADQATGADIADWLAVWISLGSVDEVAVKWR